MSRPDNAGPSATVPAGSASAVEAAKADAAARTGIAAAAWQVTRLEAVQWSDASLGCPKPDQMYAAVLTPGFLIELTAQGRVLVYHSGPNNRVVYCP